MPWQGWMKSFSKRRAPCEKIILRILNIAIVPVEQIEYRQIQTEIFVHLEVEEQIRIDH
jgi:hypothetical protein